MTNLPTPNPIKSTDTIREAQHDMRHGYADGSLGMMVSGVVWLTSAVVASQWSDTHAIWTLLIGGMFIFPLGVLVAKLIKVSGSHTKGNPLGNLAMEGTIFMIMCLPLAYGLSLLHTEWFFQGMLLIIGGRYLTFASIYGLKLYWMVGAVLGAAAYLLFFLRVGSFGSALTGGLIEILFGIYMLISFRKKQQNTASASLK